MSAEIPRDGAMHPLAVDPRDESPDGRVVGALTLHVAGVTDRAAVETSLRRMVEQMPRPADETMQGPLCGVQHVEDIGIWQTPYSGASPSGCGICSIIEWIWSSIRSRVVTPTTCSVIPSRV